MSLARAVRAGSSGALAAWGAALLLRPASAVRAVCGAAPLPPTAVVRALGARRVAQHLLVLLAPSRPVVLAAAGTDAVHAVSMLAAAARWPRYRRPALTSAAVAAPTAAVTVLGGAGGRGPDRSVGGTGSSPRGVGSAAQRFRRGARAVTVRR